MKKHLLFTLLLAVTLGGKVMAQEFVPALTETLQKFHATEDQGEKLNQSNRLDLIAKKFNTEWSAAYYAAWSKILLNYEEPDKNKKDALLDAADDWLKTASELADKSNALQQSELHALQAMVANARIGVEPEKRWMKYGKPFNDHLEEAKKLNPDNPRIYFLKGTSLFYTPAAFGGGKKKALEYFERAAALFQRENKEDITVPTWGTEINEYYIKECAAE